MGCAGGKETVGIAMAAREGDAWEVTHRREAVARWRRERKGGDEGAVTRSWRMGCPACCSRAYMGGDGGGKDRER